MAKHCKKTQGQKKLIKSLQVQFIFCLCLSKEGAQLLQAKKKTPQPVSNEVGTLPFWCCQIISAAEVTGIEVVLKLSTVSVTFLWMCEQKGLVIALVSILPSFFVVGEDPPCCY